MFRKVMKALRSSYDYFLLPFAAKKEHLHDLFGLSSTDPGVDKAVEECLEWLGRAQDNSLYRDGGVARHFSLISGWSSSYPETTGYIVPTILDCARMRGDEALRLRAKRMLDWFISIQLEDGGFQGGLIDSNPIVPVTFNTGQILLGLVHGVREFGDEYYEAMRSAANWLVETQDSDGCWRKNPTPFAAPGEKVYETHVAWSLFEAAALTNEESYNKAALKNVHWALKFQRKNGWFANCCLEHPSRPLTHTLGYALRGIIEAYRFTKKEDLLHACCKTADGLLTVIRDDGYLTGRMYEDWKGAVSWACLTGSVQIAICWLILYQFTGNIRYRDAAFAVNKYVRRTMNIDGSSEIRGAIKGSFPVYGGFGKYEYLNWAAKFFIDANILEKKVREE